MCVCVCFFTLCIRALLVLLIVRITIINLLRGVYYNIYRRLSFERFFNCNYKCKKRKTKTKHFLNHWISKKFNSLYSLKQNSIFFFKLFYYIVTYYNTRVIILWSYTIALTRVSLSISMMIICAILLLQYIHYTHSINCRYIIIMCNKISFFCVSAVYSPCYLID